MEQLVKPCEKRLPVVLVVDDNPAIRNVISWSLKLGGYEPIEATNGWEAVAWMEQAASEQRYPAVILLDLAMPGMNGESFLHWLQNVWPQRYPHNPIPTIIIITAGYANECALNAHVKQVVTKPFRMYELLEIVHKWATCR